MKKALTWLICRLQLLPQRVKARAALTGRINDLKDRQRTQAISNSGRSILGRIIPYFCQCIQNIPFRWSIYVQAVRCLAIRVTGICILLMSALGLLTVVIASIGSSSGGNKPASPWPAPTNSPITIKTGPGLFPPAKTEPSMWDNVKKSTNDFINDPDVQRVATTVLEAGVEMAIQRITNQPANTPEKEVSVKGNTDKNGRMKID
ncbi:MAG: hypothetical protein ACKVY0_04725 [Prosthecobacter sp.]|uniref:hypothetical protein n=1 Tax=Prosthecobacter sp. TaxID=1965333 RepID=UPI00390072DB